MSNFQIDSRIDPIKTNRANRATVSPQKENNPHRAFVDTSVSVLQDWNPSPRRQQHSREMNINPC